MIRKRTWNYFVMLFLFYVFLSLSSYNECLFSVQEWRFHTWRTQTDLFPFFLWLFSPTSRLSKSTYIKAWTWTQPHTSRKEGRKTTHTLSPAPEEESVNKTTKTQVSDHTFSSFRTIPFRSFKVRPSNTSSTLLN